MELALQLTDAIERWLAKFDQSRKKKKISQPLERPPNVYIFAS